MSVENRRPIASRESPWAQRITQWLIDKHQTPNSISVWSMVFAAIGAAVLLLAQGAAWSWLLFALSIQLRLLCNLFDGMVAIGSDQASSIGALYNEVPDRVSDSIFFISAAYAIGLPTLGWLCALFAALTAYIRVLGGSLNLPQLFIGPLAKQQRMAVLTLASVISIWEVHQHQSFYAISIALIVIGIGSLYTCYRRLQHIAKQLHQQHHV